MTNPEDTPKTNEVVFFLKQIPGLWAGRTVPTYSIHEKAPGSIDKASVNDLRLLLQVATHQLEYADQHLERIRQRSQFLFTALLALVGFAALTLRAVVEETSVVGFLVWVGASTALVLALLGATAVIVNEKVMGQLDAGWLSRQTEPWLPALTNDALTSVQQSHTTVANQLTYFRDSALLTLLGAFMLAASWLIAVV